MRTKRQTLHILMQTFKQAYSQYTWHIVLLSILGFFRGFFDSIGIAAIIPLFAFVIDKNTEKHGVYTFIEKIFSTLHISFTLSSLLIFVCVIFLCKFFVVISTYAIKIHITTSYEQKTRTSLYQSFLDTTWPYILKQKIGFLENVIMSDVRQSQVLLQKVSTCITLISSLLVYLYIAFRISPSITAITLCFGFVLSVLFWPIIKKTKHYSKKNAEYNKKVANHINEHMIGMKIIKTLGAEAHLGAIAHEYFVQLQQVLKNIFLLRNFMSSLLEPISVLFILSLFYIAYKQPGFNIAEFAVVMFLVQRMFQYISQLQNTVHVMTESLPYTKYVIDYANEAKQHKERSLGTVSMNTALFKESLTFHNVSFSYKRNGQPFIHNMNFSIQSGDMVGIIGPSGAGKTTIVDLVLQLFLPTSGTIFLGKTPIQTFAIEDWRKYIGYVSQDIFLLHGSISENIRFYQKNMTDKQIVQAAKDANIYEFIMDLPQQFNTIVGERGIRLSAGQRQRIAIARILARNPALLILDEATSALDSESEKVIQEFITTCKGKKTIIIVAHRLSTVLACDNIFVVKEGSIVEQGAPMMLKQIPTSYFSQMYSMYTQ